MEVFTPVQAHPNFGKVAYQQVFLCLSLSFVCGLESINDKLSLLNSLITECIDHLASLLSIKGIRPQCTLGALIEN